MCDSHGLRRMSNYEWRLRCKDACGIRTASPGSVPHCQQVGGAVMQLFPPMHPATTRDVNITTSRACNTQQPCLLPSCLLPGGVLSSPSVSGQQVLAHQGPLQLLIREYDEGRLLREDALLAEEIKTIFGFLWGKGRRRIRKGMRRVLMRREPRFQKKLGEVVYKGHYSYQLMLELQLGIRYCVGRTLRPRGSADRGSTGGHTLVGRFLSGVPLHHGHASSGGALSSNGPTPNLAVPSAPAAVLHAAAGAAPPLVPADFAEKIHVNFPSAGRWGVTVAWPGGCVCVRLCVHACVLEWMGRVELAVGTEQGAKAPVSRFVCSTSSVSKMSRCSHGQTDTFDSCVFHPYETPHCS